jgi:hypothetical protein
MKSSYMNILERFCINNSQMNETSEDSKSPIFDTHVTTEST